MIKLLQQQFKAFRSVHKGLIRKNEGSFPVLQKAEKVSYKLELSPKLKIHLMFHVSMLKPYHEDKDEDPKRGESQRAPTAVVASFDPEIDKIEAKRQIQWRGVPSYHEYNIRWKGLPGCEAT